MRRRGTRTVARNSRRRGPETGGTRRRRLPQGLQERVLTDLLPDLLLVWDATQNDSIFTVYELLQALKQAPPEMHVVVLTRGLHYAMENMDRARELLGRLQEMFALVPRPTGRTAVEVLALFIGVIDARFRHDVDRDADARRLRSLTAALPAKTASARREIEHAFAVFVRVFTPTPP